MAGKGEIKQRMHDLALEETLQVQAGSTIVSPTTSTSSPLADTLVTGPMGDEPADAPSGNASTQGLPRISLGSLESPKLPSGSNARAPDLHFVKLLGEGGMGRVHLASQSSLRRSVAVKTLKDGASRHAHDALLSEARVTGNLAHPGIIPVHSLGLDEEERPVLVMKCIEGVPWDRLLSDADNPAWEDWDSPEGNRLEVHLGILMKVCDALHFAHNQGVVHRDVKPENVMLGHYGEVYLVDWGLACAVDGNEANQLVGTPAYMAPEMALGGSVDARTDVYLLGATLHEILTGQYLHTGATLKELLEHAVESAPYAYASDLPLELAALCAAATSKEAEGRPESAQSFRQGITSYLSHRASYSVSSAASRRLDAAENSLGDVELGRQERAYHVGSNGAEARFGFQEALKAWPENSAAQEGLERSLALLVHAHLLRRDPVGAKAQLEIMEQKPKALCQELQSLKEELAREEVDQERLKKIDRDLDESMGFRTRLFSFLVILVVTSAISAVLLISGRSSAITNRGTVIFISGLLCLGTLLLVAKRKMLFSNAFNRRLVAFNTVAMVAMLINRLLGWHLATPVPQVLLTDLLLVATATTIAGFSITPWIRWMTPFLLIGAAVIAFIPSVPATTAFAGFAFLALAAGGVAWLFQARGSAAATKVKEELD